MIRAIAARLGRLTDDCLNDIAYPMITWMHQIEERLYGDASAVLPQLWQMALRAPGREASHVAPRTFPRYPGHCELESSALCAEPGP